ncbi:MAG: HD-GYP domain-containing protein [Synergistaceae bacterium]|jgi:HD-GYP domain-containing protein (c-di-GMP phosphodiesterase class II)|nr:HD-GYP domain-containing protein [Synergistaceae bacterium]
MIDSKTLKIPIDALGESEGVVAQEVVSKKGVVILPAGVDISLFEASMGMLVKKMRENGVEFVKVNAPQQLSDDDIEDIIAKVYSDEGAIISKDKARDVVKHVDIVFNSIRDEDEIRPEMVNAMSNMGRDLTEDLLRNPSVAFSLGKVQEADEYTFVHSFNVAVLTGFLANRIYPGDREYLQTIVIGGLMHDLGKSKVPIDILNKPAPLTTDEFTEMKRHPNIGVSLALKAGVQDKDIIAVISGHHEKWSGMGYPNKKRGLDIPESARIAAVADVFDALTAKRVYKNPMSSRNAISMILKDAGVHFDTRVAREMLVSIGLYPPGSIVSLSDGRICIVVSGNGKDLVRPVIMLKEPKKKDRDGSPVFIDLKNERDLCIDKYLGHGDKRELGI